MPVTPYTPDLLVGYYSYGKKQPSREWPRKWLEHLGRVIEADRRNFDPDYYTSELIKKDPTEQSSNPGPKAESVASLLALENTP